MNKKNNKDVLQLFHNLKKILDDKPSMKTMFEEVRMMQFKIRPISGDISLLHLKNERLLEVVWSLGKLDEVFQKEYLSLSHSQKDVFFRFFDELYKQFEDQLNRINLKPEKVQSLHQVMEMEIFKDITKKIVN